MKQFFKSLFDDNNTINEKSVVGFIAFFMLVIALVVDLVTGYFGNALIINEYKPSIKLFEYFNKMNTLIGYSNTNFSSFDEFFKGNFYKFKKYYLLYEETNSFIKCNDFMNMIIEKIKILNRNSVI